jgi:hypothetical protein
MDENKSPNIIEEIQLSFDPGLHSENRQEHDRRAEPSNGFTYISSVGWIDRRERLRRKDDPLDF